MPDAVSEMHEHETRSNPVWLTLLVIALVIGGSYFKSRHGSNV